MFNFLPSFMPIETVIKWISHSPLWQTVLHFFSSYKINEAMLFKIAQATDETLFMTLGSGFWGTLIGLPLGVLLFITRRGQILQCNSFHILLSGITNIFRSIPFIIMIFWLIPFTTKLVGTFIGMQAALVPLSIGVSPLIARMVENALLEVPQGLIEAARSMGATPFQIVRKVLIAEAMPVLVNSITITLITLIGYTAMAGAVGAGGLGQLAYQYGYTMYKPAIMNFVLILLIIIVFITQFIGSSIVKRVSHH